MKKFIAVLLTFAIIFTLGIPAFAAQDNDEENIVAAEANGYFENLLSVYSAGAENLENGIVLAGFSTISAVPMCFIPFGALVAFLGTPAGMTLTAIGIGELISAPVIAIFMDENTNLEPLEGFDADEIFAADSD